MADRGQRLHSSTPQQQPPLSPLPTPGCLIPEDKEFGQNDFHHHLLVLPGLGSALRDGFLQHLLQKRYQAHHPLLSQILFLKLLQDTRPSSSLQDLPPATMTFPSYCREASQGHQPAPSTLPTPSPATLPNYLMTSASVTITAHLTDSLQNTHLGSVEKPPTSFLLPRLVQPHPAEGQGSRGHQPAWKRATTPRLGTMNAATPHTGTQGASSTTQALLLPKERLGHTNALQPMPPTQVPQLWCVNCGWMPGAHQAPLSLSLLKWTRDRKDDKRLLGQD